MTYDTKTGQVQVALPRMHGFIFERTDNGVIAKNDEGEVLYSSVQSENGDVSIYDVKASWSRITQLVKLPY